MTFTQLHVQARVINDDAMRLGCEPPAVVESLAGEHTMTIDCTRYVCYERARYRRAVANGEDPFDA